MSHAATPALRIGPRNGFNPGYSAITRGDDSVDANSCWGGVVNYTGRWYLWLIRHLLGNSYTGFTFSPEDQWILDAQRQAWRPSVLPRLV